MAGGSKIAYWGASALALGAVAGIGVWANGQPPEVPLKVEPAPASKPASAPRATIEVAAEPVTMTGSRTSVRRVAVDVEGAVAMPGVYYLLEGDRVQDALRRAGGATGRGSTAGLNLAAPLRDGMKIVVPFAGTGVPAGYAPPASAPPPSAPPEDAGGGADPGLVTVAPAAEGEPVSAPRSGASRGRKGTDLAPFSVDVNAADAGELARLPGVGPSTAGKIVEERARRGGFRSVEELLDVKGIGPAKLEKMRPYIRV